MIRAESERYERPDDLGRLEVTVTPIGPFDAETVERYAEIGIDRLVLLPRPDAPRDRRHEPVPVEEILRTIDAAAKADR